MKRIRLLIFYLTSIASFFYSQNSDTIQLSKTDSTVMLLMQEPDSLINSISLLPHDSLLIYKKTCTDLQDSISRKEHEVKFLKDSIKTLNLSLNEKNINTSEHETLKLVKDTIVLKLINSRLQTKFNKSINNEASKLLQSISSIAIKDGDLYKILHSLTQRYERDFKDIIVILQKAQDSSMRENKFGFNYSEDYKDKFKNSLYYREIYNNEWTIPYMDWLIDEAFKRLENHDLDKEVYADFSDLIK